MIGNDNNETDAPTVSTSIGTVALSGYMFGPRVTGSGGPEERQYVFDLTNPSDPNKQITVNWQDIRWIDAYPHPGAGEPGGYDAHKLGRRTIWLDTDSPQIGEFLNGEIVDVYVPPGDNLAGWHGPVMLYGAGPMGSTFPPCLCPRRR